MKRMWIKVIGAVALFMCLCVGVKAAPVISLLTCGPTDDYVFSLYGHTALRVQDRGTDVVYNYGYFSLEQRNFIINFVMGKPMYSVGVITFDNFLLEYQSQGRSVVEQVLNLTPEEAQAMSERLQWNVLPENRNYQYNFYFDNCATRPRDFIEEFSGGLDYLLDPNTIPTFREAIRNKSNSAQWYTMGTDLCLGWKTDRRMTEHDAAFLPELLEQELDLAVRRDSGAPIVLSKVNYLPQTKVIGGGNRVVRWPFWTPLLVAILYVILLYQSIRGGREIPLRILRSILYTVLAIGGVALYFLGLVSSHPHTIPNANMLLMHPLYFMLLVWIWRKDKLGRPLYWLYFINFVGVVCYLGLGYKQVLPEGMVVWGLLMAFDFFIGVRTNRLIAEESRRATDTKSSKLLNE